MSDQMQRAQEQTIIDALVTLEPAEHEKTLVDEAIHVIQKKLECSGEEADGFLRNLEKRNLIERALTNAGGSPTQRSRWRWKRPK